MLAWKNCTSYIKSSGMYFSVFFVCFYLKYFSKQFSITFHCGDQHWPVVSKGFPVTSRLFWGYGWWFYVVRGGEGIRDAQGLLPLISNMFGRMFVCICGCQLSYHLSTLNIEYTYVCKHACAMCSKKCLGVARWLFSMTLCIQCRKRPKRSTNSSSTSPSGCSCKRRSLTAHSAHACRRPPPPPPSRASIISRYA